MDNSKNDAHTTSQKEQTLEGSSTGNTIVPSSATEYAAMVRTWLWAYHCWSLNQCLATPLFYQQTLLSQQIHQQQQLHNSTTNQSLNLTSSPLVSSSTTVTNQSNELRQRTHGETTSTTAVNGVPQTQQGHNRYYIASYGKRLLAEIIDGLFCFGIKLMLTYMLVEYSIVDLDQYERLFGSYADLRTFIDVMHGLLPLEIASKLFISCLEACYLSYGTRFMTAGCTPGKAIMGIRVLACDDVTSASQTEPQMNGNNEVIVIGARNIPLLKSFMRACIKNYGLGFVFPLSLMMYIGRHNRAMYDMFASTVVVESVRPPAVS